MHKHDENRTGVKGRDSDDWSIINLGESTGNDIGPWNIISGIFYYFEESEGVRLDTIGSDRWIIEGASLRRSALSFYFNPEPSVRHLRKRPRR